MKLSRLLIAAIFIVGTAFAGLSYAQTDSKASDVDSLVKLSKGFSRMLGSPKSKTKDAGDADVQVPAPRDFRARLPFPRNCGAFLRVSSLGKLDQSVGRFFKGTSDAEFSVLATLRLTDYRKVIGAIDPNAELAIMGFCESAPPRFAVVLPVRENKFATFVEALAQTVPEKDRSFSIGSDGRTANFSLSLPDPIVIVARQVNPGYVALVQAKDAILLDEFEPNRLVSPNDEPPPSLIDPTITFESTVVGLEQLTREDRPFWIETTQFLEGIEDKLANMQVAANIAEIREHIRQNLGHVRIDVSADNFGVYVSTQTFPRPNSQGEKIHRSYRNLTMLNADADRFFTVLPDVEAPISGHAEIPAELAKALPKPFNRLQFVEYSLNLPEEKGLPAESWQFYLEVDDADEFVKEMIIPKAREIGSYVGSKQVEDIGAQLFGAIAERRLDRQQNRRRPPRNYADPEAAAQRGATLGNLLGGALGSSAGEQAAMKPYKFDNFTMYVSDLETYSRQKSLMKAEAEGTAPKDGPSLLFDRDRPLLSALDVLMANVQNGDALQSALLSSANAKAEQVDDSPLFARVSTIVVLDKKHVLIGLGDETLLHYAVNNWKSLSNEKIRYLALRRDRDSLVALNNLIRHIPNLPQTYLTSAIRLDLASGQAYYNWIAGPYLKNAPKWTGAELPGDMPKPLVVSSIGPVDECTRVVAPYQTISGVFTTFSGGKTPLQLILQSTANSSDDSDEDESEDLDDVFN